jgi:acetoin utilization deacetylase AcuC-like enzyme
MVHEADGIHVFWHSDVLLHDAGSAVLEAPASPLLEVAEPHVEGPDRVRNMRSILERGPLAPRLSWHAGRRARPKELHKFHSPEYVAELQAAEAAGGRWFSGTTYFGGNSFKPACTAAGTALSAMSYVMDGHADIAYALVRPPGHHAAPETADGYCFFNNTALAAQLALDRGARRVAIIDWDVHHGNGTQEGFYERDDVFTISIHMDHGAWGPTHPQTGKANEVGRGRGLGFNLNVPLPMGTGDAGYAQAMEEVVRPAIDEFGPDMIVVANGQDASQFDPNGRQLLSMAGFRELGAEARALADAHTGGRLVLVQEGGYQMSYAAFCLHASLEGVLGIGPMLDDPIAYLSDSVGFSRDAITNVLETRSKLLHG